MGTVFSRHLRPARRIQHDGVILPYDYMEAIGYVVLQVRHWLSWHGRSRWSSWAPCCHDNYMNNRVQ